MRIDALMEWMKTPTWYNNPYRSLLYLCFAHLFCSAGDGSLMQLKSAVQCPEFEATCHLPTLRDTNLAFPDIAQDYKTPCVREVRYR